jgi:uncharacterized membrane protein
MSRNTVKLVVYALLGLVALSITLELLPFILIGGLIYYGYLRYSKKWRS